MSDRREKRQAALERLAGVSHTQPTHEHSTDNTQTTHERSTEATQATHEAMKRYDVRFTETEWAELGRIAKRDGTSRGAIVRRLVREYLRRQ